MLKFFTRKRATRRTASTARTPVPASADLRIGNLLDHPALQQVMNLDLDRPDPDLADPSRVAEPAPLFDVRFDRRQLLDFAA